MVPLKFVCFVRSYPARGNLPLPTNDPQRAWRKRFEVQIFIEKGMANEKSDFLAKYARDFAPWVWKLDRKLVMSKMVISSEFL